MAAWFRSSIQSSMGRAGHQWNIPVESYFISVFSKSKSFESMKPAEGATGGPPPLSAWDRAAAGLGSKD